jgi:F-type H+-transporting ATPase subunit delta
VIVGSIARRYAKALLAIGIEKKSFEALGREVEGLSAVVSGNPELGDTLSSPVFPLSYRGLCDQQLGRVRATVTSAQPLPELAVVRLRTALGRVSGRKVMLEQRVDPEIIGGLRTQLGDLVLDGSVRAQLSGMREAMLRQE